MVAFSNSQFETSSPRNPPVLTVLQNERVVIRLTSDKPAAFGAFESLLMQSTSPESYATTLRWAHVPLTGVVVSAIGFVYFYFGTGLRWLAALTCGLRLLGLVLNFATGANINYREVTSLDHITLWGQALATPIGVVNPWTLVPQVSNVLLVLFVIGSSIALWRRGDANGRRRALVVGGKPGDLRDHRS
jgi:hypothetical protein